MKWYQYLEDAKEIKSLWDKVNLDAMCEDVRVVDYSIGDFVRAAKRLLDLMQRGQRPTLEAKNQIELLKKYINKYEIKDGQVSINKCFEELGI